MAVPTILDNSQHMYKVDDFIDFDPLKIHDLNNKLFCTFTTLEDLDSLLDALNELIKNLNGGVVDTKFPIEWQHYKNTILLTQHDELKQLKTKIYKIIEV